ncbi:MAG TPA: ABC transporter substrate-binding protein [Anaeromyxobacteraceae bacterium]|nr:ABC transporter substrate-binding protein [Anaeromyxobacteraceae bacterium]
MTRRVPLALALALALCALACRRPAPVSGPLRIGYFPNITHAQALVGDADGTFAAALPGKGIAAKTFNAGPTAMEALLAGELDLCYVGNAPASLAYLRSQGGLRVIAGAASGGAALVVKDARAAADLAGKRVASPQLGNSQDVALRWWLRQQGMKLGEKPPAVNVTPIANAEILALFQQGQLAGAWVPEPWAARLVDQGGGHILVDERDLWPERTFPTTVVVASERALRLRRGDLVAILRAHLALTERWRRLPDEFARASNAAFAKLTGHTLEEGVLRDAFARLEPAADPMAGKLVVAGARAAELGLAPRGDLSGLVDATLLAEARGEASRR